MDFKGSIENKYQEFLNELSLLKRKQDELIEEYRKKLEEQINS